MPDKEQPSENTPVEVEAPEVTLGEIADETDPDRVEPTEAPVSLAEAYRNSLDTRYPALKLTPSGARRVKEFVRNMRMGGPTGVLLQCTGEYCEYRSACPLYAEKAHPEGDACPLEAMVIMDTRQQLGKIVDLGVENPIIQRYINELCHIAQMEWRCQMKLAFDYHDVVQAVPAAVTPEGTVHTRPEASPLLDALDKLSSRRSRLLKELAQTEEAKWRREAALGEKGKDSLARQQAARRAAIQGKQGILPKAIPPPEHVQLPSGDTKSPTPSPDVQSDAESK